MGGMNKMDKKIRLITLGIDSKKWDEIKDNNIYFSFYDKILKKWYRGNLKESSLFEAIKSQLNEEDDC